MCYVGRCILCLALLLVCLGGPLSAQQEQRFRKLAPGVETTIPLDRSEGETLSVHDLVEIRAMPNLQWKPNLLPESRTLYEMSTGVNFRRTVRGVDFTFKPLRMIEVDIPQPSGKMQRKLIWYMVYRVTNRGGHLAPSQADDGTYVTTTSNDEFRFIPNFVLESHKGRKPAYLDLVIPAALRPIQEREDPNRPLLDTVAISARPIPVSTNEVDRSVWGVVTWQDLDPEIDFLSIYIQGLSDAYKWQDPEGAYRHGDPLGKGRRFVRKTLKLNFWFPSDEFTHHEDQLYFGAPPGRSDVYGSEEGLAYEWIYR